MSTNFLFQKFYTSFAASRDHETTWWRPKSGKRGERETEEMQRNRGNRGYIWGGCIWVQCVVTEGWWRAKQFLYCRCFFFISCLCFKIYFFFFCCFLPSGQRAWPCRLSSQLRDQRGTILSAKNFNN